MASFRRPSLRCLATCGAYSFDWLRACVKVKKRSIADAERPHRHDEQDTKATALATKPIWLPHFHQIHGPSSIRPTMLRKSATAATPRSLIELDRRVYCSVKFTVTVMMTGTGTPLSSVGVNCHCFTASSAACVEQRNRAQHLRFLHRAVGPMVASMMTTPCTRADCAIGG